MNFLVGPKMKTRRLALSPLSGWKGTFSGACNEASLLGPAPPRGRICRS